ncbi:MAG: hypothetical protein JWM25_617, partial [Thermoleophilia bacterium]|nr:hypothetical protein [Thermoleophilia bacterium]
MGTTTGSMRMTLPSNGAVTLGLAGTSTGSVGARSVAANPLLDLSIGQFLAQEEASLRQGVARVGDARAAGNFKAGLGSFTKQLESNLAPDASGKTRYDHKLDQIDDERIRILTELEANPADPSALLRRLAELDQFTQLIRKAREKQEELLAL